jgi:hypothetical protein
MQVMTKQTVTNLLSETSHKLTIDDIDSIQELDEIARRIVFKKLGEESLLSRPLIRCGVTFYPATIAKDLYWREVICGNVDKAWEGVAFLWLMSHETVPDAADGEVQKHVKDFARSLHMDEAILQEVVDHYNPKTGAAKEKDNEHSYGDVIAMLIREYGQDWEYWMNAPSKTIITCIEAWNKKQEDELRQAYRAKSGGRGTISIATRKHQLMRDFRLKTDEIRAKWQSDQ